MDPITIAMLAGSAASVGSSLMGDKFKPSAQITMTPAGQSLETSLYKSIKTDMFPKNLASKYLGSAKKILRTRQKASQRTFATSRSDESVGSGQTVRGLLAGTGASIADASAGYEQVHEMKRGHALNQMNLKQNFMNLQSNQPILQGQQSLFKQEDAQRRGADLGASLGGMAQLIALSKMMG